MDKIENNQNYLVFHFILYQQYLVEMRLDLWLIFLFVFVVNVSCTFLFIPFDLTLLIFFG